MDLAELIWETEMRQASPKLMEKHPELHAVLNRSE